MKAAICRAREATKMMTLLNRSWDVFWVLACSLGRRLPGSLFLASLEARWSWFNDKEEIDNCSFLRGAPTPFSSSSLQHSSPHCSGWPPGQPHNHHHHHCHDHHHHHHQHHHYHHHRDDDQNSPTSLGGRSCASTCSTFLLLLFSLPVSSFSSWFLLADLFVFPRFFIYYFPIYIFIGPRYTWGPIYGSESL